MREHAVWQMQEGEGPPVCRTRRNVQGLLLSGGRPLRQIAWNLGIVTSNCTPGEIGVDLAENARLRSENERLRLEREILKKAQHIFSGAPERNFASSRTSARHSPFACPIWAMHG